MTMMKKTTMVIDRQRQYVADFNGRAAAHRRRRGRHRRTKKQPTG
jgi:hypothetical protein